MRIAVASDHGGYKIKEWVKEHLDSTEHAYVDLGTHSEDSVDYPDYAEKVVHYVLHNGYDYGILVCGTGQGMAISANKHRNIRAALCFNVELAEQARSHGDCNILCLGGSLQTLEPDTIDIVDTFLQTKFDGGRHVKRIKKFST
tara:strand:- start:532 stop:963 length:432 start_codon:yes stop_codon:yes gene_type:complete